MASAETTTARRSARYDATTAAEALDARVAQIAGSDLLSPQLRTDLLTVAGPTPPSGSTGKETVQRYEGCPIGRKWLIGFALLLIIGGGSTLAVLWHNASVRAADYRTLEPRIVAHDRADSLSVADRAIESMLREADQETWPRLIALLALAVGLAITLGDTLSHVGFTQYHHYRSSIEDLLTARHDKRDATDKAAMAKASAAQAEALAKAASHISTAIHELENLLKKADAPDVKKRIEDELATLKKLLDELGAAISRTKPPVTPAPASAASKILVDASFEWPDAVTPTEEDKGEGLAQP